jgi:hypothetical protein
MFPVQGDSSSNWFMASGDARGNVIVSHGYSSSTTAVGGELFSSSSQAQVNLSGTL